MSLLLLVLACGSHQFPTANIMVGQTSMTVELAADPEQRSLGLMHRDSIPQNEGMLFLYTEESKRSFWMKNTRIPLSIAFANEDGKIMRIADMTPLDQNATKSLYPSKYALEVNRGWFAEHGIETGMLITNIPDVKIK